jgi:ribosomal protein L11 methyltransferase
MHYIWSKLSAVRWEDAWVERFRGALAERLVISYFPNGKTLRVEVYCATARDAARIQKEFGGSVRTLKERNWQAVAAERLQPIKIRDRLVICHDAESAAELRTTQPERLVLQIPGEMAFGTGDHETTSTCLRVLVDYAAKRTQGDWSLLDLGCGTGILALAARGLGAGVVDGFDFDPAAVRVANKNVTLNRLKHLKFTCDDVTKWQPTQTYDVVAANIFHDVLTLSFHNIANALTRDGLIMVSGILHTQADSCLAAGKKAGLHFTDIIRRGKWVTAVGTRPSAKKR